MSPTLNDTGVSRRTKALFACALVLLAFGFTAWAVSRLYLHHPFTDSWNFVQFLRVWHAGEAGWADFWAPYQNHRIPLARLLMAVLAQATYWNHGAEVALSLAFLAGAFCAVTGLLARTARAMRRPFPWLLLPPVALLVFNLAQAVNLVWGWQFPLVASVAAVVAALALLHRADTGWWAFTGALFLTLCATFLHGAGLLGWPACAVALAAPLLWRGAIPRTKLAVWCGVAALCAGFYFWHLGEPFRQGKPPGALEHLWITLRYVAVFLGGPVGSVRPWATSYAGLLGLAAAGAVLGCLFIRRDGAVRASAPWLGMLAYPVFAALTVAWGRARAGESFGTVAHGSLLEGAISRYPTVALWFWVALIVLGWLAFAHGAEVSRSDGAPQRHRLYATLRALAIAGLALLVLSTLLSTRQGYYDTEALQRFLYPHARSVVSSERNALPERLQYYYGDTHTADVRWLRQQGWSLFRPEWADYWRPPAE